jgi:hypothetical protein
MLLAGLLCAPACQPGEPKSMEVLWRLIDGRSCADAGVVRAVVNVGNGEEHGGRCSVFPGGNRITVPDAYPEAVLTARAESATQAALYRIALTLPKTLPEVLELRLDYSGGH